MKITCFAAGSRGDIQPCLALCRGLMQAGYQMRLAAPEDFADFVNEHGVDFAPLRGDVQAIMAGDTGRSFMESGGSNPLKSIRAVRTMIGPIVMEMVEDVYAACEDADGVICLGVFSAFGKSITDALDIPLINVEPTPLLPTRAFAAPSWPMQKNFGPWHNYLSGVAMLRVVWLWYQPFVNALRAKLGLPMLTGARFIADLRATPMISAYSPAIIPRPADWPATTHVTGYLFLDQTQSPPEEWQPPANLRAFLAAGDPPVSIGFGSMSGRNPEEMAALAIAALERCGQRGILLTGWGGLRTQLKTDDICVAEAVPHGWLFPRLAAVVHHGGAGTTAEGLRAGVPTVITPFVLDQPFWGARVQALGVGPAPIPQKKLTVDALARAVDKAVTDPTLRRRAHKIGQTIRREAGVANAVQAVKDYFGPP